MLAAGSPGSLGAGVTNGSRPPRPMPPLRLWNGSARVLASASRASSSARRSGRPGRPAGGSGGPGAPGAVPFPAPWPGRPRPGTAPGSGPPSVPLPSPAPRCGTSPPLPVRPSAPLGARRHPAPGRRRAPLAAPTLGAVHRVGRARCATSGNFGRPGGGGEGGLHAGTSPRCRQDSMCSPAPGARAGQLGEATGPDWVNCLA